MDGDQEIKSLAKRIYEGLCSLYDIVP